MNIEWAFANFVGAPGAVCHHQPTCGRSVIVEHNGDVYACDHYVYPQYRLGNMHQQTIAEMIDSPQQQVFGEDKFKQLPAQCRSCNVLKACWGGCPKHRFMLDASGKPGLNYLCAGYQRYFRHLPPYLKAMADLLAHGRPASDIMQAHLLELKEVPERLLVMGGGIIGLEMGTVYHALGSQIDVVEMFDQVIPAADKDIVKVFTKRISKKFNLMLETKVTAVEAKEDGIYVTMEGKKAPAEPQRYDAVLVAIGRVPNGKNLDAGKAGVEVDDRGFIRVDKQLRTNVPHIFAIGDIVGQPMLAHKGVHEGHVAAEVIAGKKHYFDPKVIPSIAYTEPEVAWVGLTEKEAKEKGISYETATFPWAASGRAIASDCADGMTKLIFDKESHRVIGGAIVGTNGGELLGEIGLAIEMGCDAEDIALTIHAHPTLHESVGLAAEVFEGSITDLPNPKAKKK
ncbi:FAD-dependent oxidoreductase [Escherichia sp. HC-CC4]